MAKTVYFGLLFISFLFSQEFMVKPYLQSATQSSIYILWETDSNSDSRVEWGASPSLGEITTGTAITNYGSYQLHTVQLTGLHTSMKYYYRAVTGTLSSDIYDFILPPDPITESSFRIVAMSDMQRDSSNPDKFYEIIHDGVIDYLSGQGGRDLASDLAMVLVTGDLVDNGGSYYNGIVISLSQDLISSLMSQCILFLEITKIIQIII